MDVVTAQRQLLHEDERVNTWLQRLLCVGWLGHFFLLLNSSCALRHVVQALKLADDTLRLFAEDMRAQLELQVCGELDNSPKHSC